MDYSDEKQKFALVRQQAIIDLRRMGIDVNKELTQAERDLADSYMNSALERAQMEQLIDYKNKIKEVSKGIAEDICEFSEDVLSSFIVKMIFEEAIK
jgi:hypothetical protein